MKVKIVFIGGAVLEIDKEVYDVLKKQLKEDYKYELHEFNAPSGFKVSINPRNIAYIVPLDN